LQGGQSGKDVVGYVQRPWGVYIDMDDTKILTIIRETTSKALATLSGISCKKFDAVSMTTLRRNQW
jgi:hypothetical protein